MTNTEIWRTAVRQSAIDSHCQPEDFEDTRHRVVLSAPDERARQYLELPFSCDLTSYGHNIVASVSEEMADMVETYISRYPTEHCFETPCMLELERGLNRHGQGICFMAEYFLPDVEKLTPSSCAYELRLLEPADFQDYYQPAWGNALCSQRPHLDRLAIGAFAKGELVGLAGCSADCATMWQIGVDVLPAYRRQGIASALTSRLALEIIERGKVPFYCCAWSNIGSARNALASGFRPAWVQLTAKPLAFSAQMREAGRIR